MGAEHERQKGPQVTATTGSLRFSDLEPSLDVVGVDFQSTLTVGNSVLVFLELCQVIIGDVHANQAGGWTTVDSKKENTVLTFVATTARLKYSLALKSLQSGSISKA